MEQGLGMVSGHVWAAVWVAELGVVTDVVWVKV